MDWQRGNIPYFTRPPKIDKEGEEPEVKNKANEGTETQTQNKTDEKEKTN